MINGNNQTVSAWMMNNTITLIENGALADEIKIPVQMAYGLFPSKKGLDGGFIALGQNARPRLCSRLATDFVS
jgi:hypothetical protein